jgi:lipopolysaccharide/colanic/teichoic acid biosynthesis glycosyltransferase
MFESSTTSTIATTPPSGHRPHNPPRKCEHRAGAVATRPGQEDRVAIPHTWYTAWGKRSLDLLVAGAAIVVLSPLLGLAALLTRLSLGRGILYHQPRVGYNGRDFEIIKFRTMTTDRRRHQVPMVGRDRRRAHKREDDPRHTRLGRLLRRYSIDELPQLLNVVRGEMSIVGPRPELSTVVDRRAARQHPRHEVRPGITGFWQVTQRRDGRPLDEGFDDDLAYLSEISFLTDLRVIGRTVGVVLAGSGR